MSKRSHRRRKAAAKSSKRQGEATVSDQAEQPETTEPANDEAHTETSAAPSPAIDSETPVTEGGALTDKLAHLEKLVRSVSRDNLAVVRSQRELQTAMQDVLNRLDNIELTTKGTTQNVWRATQESQKAMENAETHFADAIRDLENRIQGEMRWQFYRSALQAVFPAVEDLDSTIDLHTRRQQASGEEDPYLQALVIIRDKFDEGLRKLGLEPIVVDEGQTRFDPSLHQAVEPGPEDILPPAEDLEPGTIIRQRRPGYMLNGRVFTAPQVFVKRAT